ncbi:MAG TPA: hypothetical protein VEW25_05895 [Allosphingosinicella sp.]|nr:hypothetical protein [Allosphingosinicella sp.]
MRDEDDQEEERKREDRRAWLGEPIEHGGEYRASKGPRWAADAGCCLFEAAGAVGVLIALVLLPAWFLLS